MKMAIQKTIPVTELKPAEYNPRKKLKPGDPEYEKIKDSILEFGFADPLVVNSDMTIIGGHQRLSVAIDLGYTEVPCAVVDLDKTREKALNIAPNKITGAWDENLLAVLLKDIENSDFDLGKTGFDPPEIETLFNKVHDKSVKEDDFDIDGELQNVPFIVRIGIDDLNIRTGPGVGYPRTGIYTGKGAFTIVEVKGNWGRLKSGAGWICLGYTTRV